MAEEFCIGRVFCIHDFAPGREKGEAMSQKHVKVEDLMTQKVTCLDRNDSLAMTDEIMELGRIRHIPVLDGSKVVGVISQRDLFRSALAFALGYGEKGKKTVLGTLNVKDVMSEPAITTQPEIPITEAAQLMLENKVGCLPVIKGADLVGILTETDMLRYVAADRVSAQDVTGARQRAGSSSGDAEREG